jgi:hypothetical protein
MPGDIYSDAPAPYTVPDTSDATGYAAIVDAAARIATANPANVDQELRTNAEVFLNDEISRWGDLVAEPSDIFAEDHRPDDDDPAALE